MSFFLYHGGKAWTGDPEIRPAKKGRAFHGVGIYLTTSFETARKYSRTVYLFEIAEDFKFIDEVFIPMEDMISYVKSKKMKHWKEIIEDIRNNASRMNASLVNAEVLNNLMVNYDSLARTQGPALAEYLVSHGVSGTLVKNHTDDWLVVLDVTKILSYKKLTGTHDELDRIKKA